MNNENINSDLEMNSNNLNEKETEMNENELNEKSYKLCFVCSYCKNSYYDDEDIPRCKIWKDIDISENGEMADLKFSNDPECPVDCCDFDGMDCDEPDYEPDYDDYDGRYDYCPSIFDRL